MTIKPLLILLAGIGIAIQCQSQDNQPAIEKVTAFPARFVKKVEDRISGLEVRLNRQAERYLARLRNREAKLKRKLTQKDSLAAVTIFADAAQQYNHLDHQLQSPGKYKDYIPYLDTLSTSLRFLDQQKISSGLNGKQPQKIQQAISSIKGLETQLQKAETIKQFLKERKKFLQEQLCNYGFGKELQRLNKDAWYYAQYVNEYKSILQEPEKLERKAIELLSQTSIFQDFLRKHSFLASIFRVPGDPGNPAFQVNATGLQTRAQVNQIVQQQFASTGPNPAAAVQQNIQQAQNQLQQLKDKITNLGGSSDGEVPNFKPNNQKTKSFLKRLEFGTNIQTQRSSNYFPATSDIGVSLGYKLNDKSIAGIGVSYALGLGSGWRDIQLSSQGIGLRSYLDWKLKGSFWVSSGFEMNYRSEFNNLDQLRDLSPWQQSGLLGISKIVSLKTKVLKKTKIQLLWDFLSYRQAPHTAPLKLRLGYAFK